MYIHKYIKYKKKYLELKYNLDNQDGGMRFFSKKKI